MSKSATLSAGPTGLQKRQPYQPTEADEKAAKRAAEEKAQKEAEADLVTFAIRIPRREAEEIHAAAGPRKASRWARLVLHAAAVGDDVTLKQVCDGTFKL